MSGMKDSADVTPKRSMWWIFNVCNVEEDNVKISNRFMIFSNTADTIDIGRDQKFLLWDFSKS